MQKPTVDKFIAQIEPSPAGRPSPSASSWRLFRIGNVAPVRLLVEQSHLIVWWTRLSKTPFDWISSIRSSCGGEVARCHRAPKTDHSGAAETDHFQAKGTRTLAFLFDSFQQEKSNVDSTQNGQVSGYSGPEEARLVESEIAREPGIHRTTVALHLNPKPTKVPTGSREQTADADGNRTDDPRSKKPTV